MSDFSYLVFRMECGKSVLTRIAFILHGEQGGGKTSEKIILQLFDVVLASFSDNSKRCLDKGKALVISICTGLA